MSQDTPSKLPQIATKIDGHVGHLLLENPSKHNALTQELWQALPTKLDQLLEQGARAIVIEGAGGSFCAGADISEFSKVRRNEETARRYELANADAFAAIRSTPVPVIAKIRRYCLGGGFGISAACDIRLASEDAEFAVPAARLGLAYPLDAMSDIVHAVGTQNAKRLLYTAERFSARQMMTMGFLSEVVDADQLNTAVDRLVEKIVPLAPLTHRASKAAIAAVNGADRELAGRLGDATFASEDYAEGRLAFSQKRDPKFTGK